MSIRKEDLRGKRRCGFTIKKIHQHHKIIYFQCVPNLARLLGPLQGLNGPIRGPGPRVRQFQGPLKPTVGPYRASPCIVHTFDRVLRTSS
jgi:hypothetical protein